MIAASGKYTLQHAQEESKVDISDRIIPHEREDRFIIFAWAV